MNSRLIVLVDGNFFAWRAYATRKLSTSKGVPTSVISGMLQMIRSLYSRFNYDRIIICWDGEGGSKFRKKLFKDYKGQRKEQRDKHQTLFDQMGMARDFLSALNVRQVIIPGVEGDDLMGIFSQHYSKKGHQVIIASADRDLLQLVRKRVKVFRPGKKSELIGLKEFKQEYDGITPIDFIKLKSLMGDKSDNIPGVPGIGPKRAMDIVKRYKSLRDLIRQRSTDRNVKLVRENIEVVNLAYRLSKILLEPGKGGVTRKKFKRLLKEITGPRFVNEEEIYKQVKKFEMKYRNFEAMAKMLSVRIE